jgi:indole-3-glycerol phosphate synthase
MNVLDRILARKQPEIDERRGLVPDARLESLLADAPPPRDFFAPLAAQGPIRVIAEIKKASPSRGVLREDFDPPAIGADYERHGASCISVLTDEPGFQGRLEHLQSVRRIVRLPVLRKDFILDRYQLLEARLAGADAALLIAECLDDCHLRKLFRDTLDLGMVPLVEIYLPENLPRALEAGATLIGVNNRNLQTFEVDLENTLHLLDRIPDDCVVVGESGIRTRDDVLRLESAGVDAILVGESLMTSPAPGRALAELLGRPAGELSR